MKHYYEMPTMVKFLDPYYELMAGETEKDRPWLAGIAFGEYVICGCCGGLMELSELFEFAAGDEEYEPFDLQFEEMSWIDIKEAIIGDQDRFFLVGTVPDYDDIEFFEVEK